MAGKPPPVLLPDSEHCWDLPGCPVLAECGRLSQELFWDSHIGVILSLVFGPYIYIYIFKYIYIYIQVYIYICIYTYVYIYICIYIYIHMYIFVYIYINTDIHTHMGICNNR